MHQAHKFAESLRSEGWSTPDTYTNHHPPFPRSPGVYLFNRGYLSNNDLFATQKVLYVGKSMCVRRRLRCHPIHRLIL
jgi:excinuclease UvrABC nuclease subunit